MPVGEHQTVHTVVPDTFVLPTIRKQLPTPRRGQIPNDALLGPASFSNRRMIDRPDITEQAFVDYINMPCS